MEAGLHLVEMKQHFTPTPHTRLVEMKQHFESVRYTQRTPWKCDLLLLMPSLKTSPQTFMSFGIFDCTLSEKIFLDKRPPTGYTIGRHGVTVQHPNTERNSMSAFPTPEPGLPRVIPLKLNPTDQDILKYVLAFGERDIDRIAANAACDPSLVRSRLADPTFQATLRETREKPHKIIPSKAELIAKLIVEAERGDRSTDRQRAVEMLLELEGQRKPMGKLEKYKKR